MLSAHGSIIGSPIQTSEGRKKMARKKTRAKETERPTTTTHSPPSADGEEKRTRRLWLGLVLAALLLTSAVGGALWGQGEQGDAIEVAEQSGSVAPASAAEPIVSDVFHVNNRQCAMSDSPIAEKDLGRFESRVVYDGPIERFQGKTLVFNQCCSMCIESFPKKWAAERDQIMAKFGLADAD